LQALKPGSIFEQLSHAMPQKKNHSSYMKNELTSLEYDVEDAGRFNRAAVWVTEKASIACIPIEANSTSLHRKIFLIASLLLTAKHIPPPI